MIQSLQYWLIGTLLCISFALGAQDEITLWPEVIPCESKLVEEIEERNIGRIIKKVRTPSLTVFKAPAETSNGTSVIICPGGGYTILAWDWEGTSIAHWLNSIGVTAFVLKYRLPHWEHESCRGKVALMDAQQAMRIVRSRSHEFNIDPARIGIMGFSAGGHLASTLSTHFDLGDSLSTDDISKTSCRPDFSILIYPVISCDPLFAHQGSCINLMGKYPTEAQRLYYSNERQVASTTPPAILIHSADDSGVLVEHSISYYKALIRHKVPASMHLFPEGGHGYSMGKEGSFESRWPQLVEAWMKSAGWIIE